uniref:Uncharacterized protein n=1 Tax=Cucumis sativus TaxID=3659 RepID=A0A0A0KGB6_CUCSA
MVGLVGYEGVYVECRHLKSSRSCKKCSKSIGTSPPPPPAHLKSAGNPQQFTTIKAELPQDFRPTSPGHSPGVGHHINN